MELHPSVTKPPCSYFGINVPCSGIPYVIQIDRYARRIIMYNISASEEGIKEHLVPWW